MNTSKEIEFRSTVTLATYTGVSDVFPHFEDVGHTQQQLLLNRLSPTSWSTHHNVASVDFQTYLVDELDPNQSPTNQEPQDIQIGTDGTPPVETQNSLLNNIGSIPISSFTDNGTTLSMEGTIGESQFNGNTIREVGVTGNNGLFFNRALVGPQTKNSDETITVAVDWTFDAV